MGIIVFRGLYGGCHILGKLPYFAKSTEEASIPLTYQCKCLPDTDFCFSHLAGFWEFQKSSVSLWPRMMTLARTSANSSKNIQVSQVAITIATTILLLLLFFTGRTIILILTTNMADLAGGRAFRLMCLNRKPSSLVAWTPATTQ